MTFIMIAVNPICLNINLLKIDHRDHRKIRSSKRAPT